MSIQQNTDRIQTTHIGSLPRPHALLDLMKAKFNGEPYDRGVYDAMLTRSVAESSASKPTAGSTLLPTESSRNPASSPISASASRASNPDQMSR
jgi:hypothetical protein